MRSLPNNESKHTKTLCRPLHFYGARDLGFGDTFFITNFKKKVEI